MKSFTKWGLISAIALGIFVYSDQNINVHAASQFYYVPELNQNIQQENGGNALQSGTSAQSGESTSDSGQSTVQTQAGTPVDSQPPFVESSDKYVSSSSLNANINNPDNDYSSTNTNNGLRTFYYLPDGFHVKNTEHGNYQSSVQANGNIYIVESMGTGTNQGAIVKYNNNDLKQLGVLNSDGTSGDGRDLIWKALKYISPYTSQGNQHTTQYNDYQSLMDNANSSIKDSQTTVDNAKKTIKDNPKLIKKAQADITAIKNRSKTYLKKVNVIVKNDYKTTYVYDKKTKKKKPAKSLITPKKLTYSTFTGFFNNVVNVYQNELNKVTQSEADQKTEYRFFKGIHSKSGNYKNFTTFKKYLKKQDGKIKKQQEKASQAASSASAATSSASNSSAATSSAVSASSSSDIEKAQFQTAIQNYKITKKQFNKIRNLTEKKFKSAKTGYNREFKKFDSQNKPYLNSIKKAQSHLTTFNKRYLDRVNNQQAKINNLNAQIKQATADKTAAQGSIKGINKTVKELQNNKDLYAKYSAIAHAGQISPLINIGHGQTLSYNPATKNLYLAQDDSGGDLGLNDSNVVTELDSETLQPVKQFNFQLSNGKINMGIHTLTFDNDGNAYFGRKSGEQYQIYKGKFHEDTGKVEFAPVPQTIKWGGYHNQGLSYNPTNNRLYIVSDDIITSVPADKLGNGTVQPGDINYTAFNSGREFESLSFDDQGYGCLLALRVPEIMKTTNPMQ